MSQCGLKSVGKQVGISNDTNNSHIPVPAAAVSCHSQEVEWFHSHPDKRPFHACSAAPKISAQHKYPNMKL